MSILYRGVVVAVLHCLMVLSIAGKYAWDRERLPRVWVKTRNYDPNMPIRGRYASLALEVDLAADPSVPPAYVTQNVRLSVEDGRLRAHPVAYTTGQLVSQQRGSPTLWDPVPFFLPEHAIDPTQRKPGEELWVEVSVPRNGPPRPLRLAVKKDGVLTPLDLR
jgi:hypothetical protein